MACTIETFGSMQTVPGATPSTPRDDVAELADVRQPVEAPRGDRVVLPLVDELVAYCARGAGIAPSEWLMR